MSDKLVDRVAVGPLCGDRLGTSCTCRPVLHPSTGLSRGAQECDGEDREGKAYFEGNGNELVVFGLSQDRYNLPIQPILFLAGIVALQRLFRSRPAA